MYAAAGVLYQMMEGHPPYDLSFAGRSQREGRSAYRIKTEFSAEMPAGAHGSAADVRAVLASEPEVAVAVGRAAAELDGAPAPHRVRAALSAVDDQLAEVLMACLVPEQSRRPQARRYGRRSPCSAPSTLTTWPLSARRALGAVPFGRGGGNGQPGVVDVCVGRPAWPSTRSRRPWPSEELWLQGFSLRTWRWLSQPVSRYGRDRCRGLAVSAALLLPLAGALIARGSERDTGFGFVRGLLGSLLGGTVAGLLASLTAWPSESVSDALYAALFLAVVAPLPGLVADWALALPPLSSASSTAPLARPVLPWGAVPSEDRAISDCDREACVETTSEAI